LSPRHDSQMMGKSDRSHPSACASRSSRCAIPSSSPPPTRSREKGAKGLRPAGKGNETPSPDRIQSEQRKGRRGSTNGAGLYRTDRCGLRGERSSNRAKQSLFDPAKFEDCLGPATCSLFLFSRLGRSIIRPPYQKKRERNILGPGVVAS
jgi:hypothetical protein